MSSFTILKRSMIDKLIELLNKKGYKTRMEAEAYNQFHDLERVVAYCPHGTPRALIEVALPDKQGKVSKSLANTMIQAVPLHTVSTEKEIAQLVASLA